MKVGITLDDALVKRVDDFADANYTTRSGLIATALTQYLNAHEASLAIVSLAASMRRIADSGTIDDQARAELASFQSFANMLAGMK